MSGEGESVWGPVSVSHSSTEPPLGAAGRGSSESEIPGGGGSLPAVTVDQGLGTGGQDGPGSQSGSVLASGSGTEVSGSAGSQPAVATVSFLADSLPQQEGGGVAVADYDTMEEAEFSPNEEINVAWTFNVEGSHCVVFASTDTLRCFKCGAHGHQRKNCPVRESEGVQEGQGEIGGEAVRDDRGEQEDEPLQSEISAGPSEQAETVVQFAGQENKDGDSADNQGFIMVEKRKRNKKTDKTVKENESVLERSSGAVSSDLGLAQHTRFEAGGGGVVPGSDRRLRSGLGGHGTAGVESRGVGAPDSNPGGSHGSSGSQLGAAVPPCSEGEEHSAESLLGAAVNPSLPDSPQSAVVEAGEENWKTATVTVENDSNDEYEEEMNEAEEGEASDSSLFSNIPDSQTAKKKLYSANEIGEFLDMTKGRRGIDIKQTFPDLKLFLNSAHIALKKATIKEIDQPKRYRLKKLMQTVRKMLNQKN
ncbi:UNVERIFIED_CONTAM: hypothetical protein FKN15_006777 [Acipenser sinensis]